MIVLSADQPLPHRPHRVLVCGVSGSGKTTLAARLGGILGLPHTDIDSLHWGPDWTPRPQFSDDVDALIAGDEWITEWSYRLVRERLLDRADLLVWIDHPFRVTLQRAARRAIRRRVRREVLWSGNVEPPLHTFFTRPDDNILRWTIATRDKYRRRVPEVAAERPELPIVRLASPAEAAGFAHRLITDPPR
ncbi:adenylate kinase [Schumannella luteola]